MFCSLGRVGLSGLVGVLQSVSRDAHKWGVGNPDKVALFEVCDTC